MLSRFEFQSLIRSKGHLDFQENNFYKGVFEKLVTP
jgi:hypothetical protein